MAQNLDAFRSRGITLAAISTDPSGESIRFAREYGIRFPLLADVDGRVSRAYTGIDAADVTVPGIVVIRDGKVVFRQVAEAKSDRLTGSELLAVVDRSLGTSGLGIRAGYAVLERLQLRVDLSGGANARRATAGAALAALYPLHRYLAAGPFARGDFRDGMIDLDAMVAVRVPLIADRGAIELAVAGGYTAAENRGPNASARIGAWVALSPTLALQLAVGVGARRLDDEPLREVFVTFGVTRLFQLD